MTIWLIHGAIAAILQAQLIYWLDDQLLGRVSFIGKQ